MLAGVTSSSQNGRILIENPLAGKNDSAKLIFKNLQTYSFHLTN